MEGEQTFDIKWMRFWNTLKWDRMNRYILVDPASEKKKSSDYTVMIVIGLGPDRNYYVIDMIRDKLSMQEKAQRLFSLHQQYAPLGVGYEKYGMQSDIAYLNEVMENRQYRFTITELGGSMPKNDRIRRIQPLFQEGRVWLPERLIRTDYQGRSSDLVQAFIQDEFLAFPYMAHDDMLDCLARITEESMNTFFPRVQVEGRQHDLEDEDENGYSFDTFDYLKEKRYA
jgi:predicted phage terminase large subunit-like protein